MFTSAITSLTWRIPAMSEDFRVNQHSLQSQFYTLGFQPFSSSICSREGGEQSAMQTLRLAAHCAAQAPWSKHCWSANTGKSQESMSSSTMAKIWKTNYLQYRNLKATIYQNDHCSLKKGSSQEDWGRYFLRSINLKQSENCTFQEEKNTAGL